MNNISDLIGVFDVDKEQCQKVSNNLGVKCYDSIDLLLDNVEAVSIVVPTKLHWQISQQVISKGVNLLVEKPLSKKYR